MALAVPDDTPLDLTNSNRWTLRTSTTVNQVNNGDGTFDRPPLWEPVTLFTSPILAIQSTSTDPRQNKLVGILSQIQDNTIPPGIPLNITTRRIWRGSMILRFAQDLEGDYRIEIQTRLGVIQATYLIYEYL